MAVGLQPDGFLLPAPFHAIALVWAVRPRRRPRAYRAAVPGNGPIDDPPVAAFAWVVTACAYPLGCLLCLIVGKSQVLTLDPFYGFCNEKDP